jgi:serine/threonine protein kinase
MDEQLAYLSDHKSKCIGVAQQLAKGIAFLHKKGIMHRDIKPQNVLMTSDLVSYQ